MTQSKYIRDLYKTKITEAQPILSLMAVLFVVLNLNCPIWYTSQIQVLKPHINGINIKKGV